MYRSEVLQSIDVTTPDCLTDGERARERDRASPIKMRVPTRTWKRCGFARASQAPCISCMFFIMASSAAFSSSAGLKERTSLLASWNGTWPGGA
jgi:hypothetical protein